MADKEKRLRKILVKKGWKGKLKSVATLEEARLVLVNRRGHSELQLIGKDNYLTMIEKGYTFPEEEVYYVVSPNPRDSKHIEEKYVTNAVADVKPSSI